MKESKTMTSSRASIGPGSSAPASEADLTVERVTELGRAIVDSFEHDDDRLSNWMAHRLAELLDKSEHGRTRADRETAASQAADLTIQLWRHRHEWRSRWPPRDLGRLLELLQELETSPPILRERQGPTAANLDWLTALKELDDLTSRETFVTRSAALVAIDEAEVGRWLTAANVAGETDETLEQLQRNIEAARRHLSGDRDPRLARSGSEGEDVSVKDLEQNALLELVALNARRAELYAQIAKGRGLRQTPSGRRSRK